MERCPVCKKVFPVLYRHLWAYRRREHFICSWHCLRAFDKEIGEKPMSKHITLEEKKKAVQIAIDGGSPLAYLRTLGVNDPVQMFGRIRKKLQETEPELYAQIPDLRRKKDQPEKEEKKPTITLTTEPGQPVWTEEEVKHVQAMCAENEVLVEAPRDAVKPVNLEDFMVTEVKGQFGKYRRVQDFIDFESGTDSLSMNIDEWRGFFREMKHAAQLLGVEL